MKNKKIPLGNLTTNEKWSKLLSFDGLATFILDNFKNKEAINLQSFLQAGINEKEIINELLKKDFTSIVPMETRINILSLISSYYYDDLKERYQNY